MSGTIVRVALILGIAFLSACEAVTEPTPSEQPTQVLSEHRFTLSREGPDREVGEDCTANGHSACRSGLCIHAKAKRGAGYVCSTRCQQNAECPGTWHCVSIIPGVEERVCLPAEADTSSTLTNNPRSASP